MNPDAPPDPPRTPASPDPVMPLAKREPADMVVERLAAPQPEPEPLRQSKGHEPGLRNIIHLAGILVAFPLTKLDKLGLDAKTASIVAGSICFVAMLFNLLILPHMKIGKQIRRSNEHFVNGMWLYPLGLSFAFFIFPPFAVGAAWAAMAAGDAAASYIGRGIPRPTLPWNREKGWAGTFAFGIAALPLCWLLLWWCCPDVFQKENGSPEMPYVWTLAVIAAVSGALLESLRGPLDDNLRVSLGVSLIVWLAVMFLSFSTSGMPGHRVNQPELFLHAIIANVILAFVALGFRFVDVPGAIAGIVLGSLVYYLAAWQGYVLMAVFVVGGSIFTRIGKDKKETLGTSEARAGKRGIANVLSNLGPPAVCALLYPATKGEPWALMAFCGAIAAVFADTAASELGTLSSHPPFLITTRKEVSAGTDGAVSIPGYVAAFCVAVLLAIVAWATGYWSWIAIGDTTAKGADPTQTLTVVNGLALSVVLVLAGLIGTTVDSYLGATVEGKIPGFGKGAVNFMAGASGAVFAGFLGWLLITK